jgi:hypothetical protein
LINKILLEIQEIVDLDQEADQIEEDREAEVEAEA